MPATTQQVAIVTDSTVSLPRSMLEQWGIHLVPLELRFGDRVYRDGEDLDPTTFYQMLQTADLLPTTSAPRPASFLEAFRRASATANHVLCLTLISHLSATHELAVMVADLARQALAGVTVQVVDTRTAAGAQALVALAAAKAARQGHTPEQVLETCRTVMDRVNLVAFLDTLHFLWRGGHVPRVAAWMGAVLNVKPMLEMKNGNIRLVARPRTRPRATDRLLSIMAQRTQGRPVVVNVIHAADPEGANQLYQRVLAQFSCQEVFISEFSPVIGVHTGPGLLGLAFYVVD